MAKKNVRSRIERVLRLEQPSRGVLKRTVWVLILATAMPVIYLASSVQNASSVSRTPAYGDLLAALGPSSKPAPVPPAAVTSEVEEKLKVRSLVDAF